jgi:hypothetical protein
MSGISTILNGDAGSAQDKVGTTIQTFAISLASGFVLFGVQFSAFLSKSDSSSTVSDSEFDHLRPHPYFSEDRVEEISGSPPSHYLRAPLSAILSLTVRDGQSSEIIYGRREYSKSCQLPTSSERRIDE